jgi:ankyrin repeat protein
MAKRTKWWVWGLGMVIAAIVVALLTMSESVEDKVSASELREAIGAGDIETVSKLLERGVDLNATLEYGPPALVLQEQMTPLLWAADCGHADIVKLLLEKGADPNTRDYRGRTALFKAGKNVPMAKMLLARGADPNVRDQDGATPLWWAAHDKAVAIVNALLDHGADVNAQEKDGGTALMAAAEQKQGAAVLKALVARGANVKARTREGHTALSIATLMGYSENVRLLKRVGDTPAGPRASTPSGTGR